MASWPEVREKRLYEAFTHSAAERRWRLDIFDRTYSGEIGTWDYQWSYAKHMSSGLTAVPSRNLILNIGFGPDATHTTGSPSGRDGVRELSQVEFPLEHPEWVLRDPSFDREYLRQFVGLGSPFSRVLGRLKTGLGRST